MKRTAVFIPARYHSTRFPGKPLTMLNGKTMIQTVAEKCKSFGYDTFVLTDHKLIAQAAQASGVNFYIDSTNYENGTERCAGAVFSRKFDDYDYFINVQGDMPDVTQEMVDQCKFSLGNHYQVSTVYTDMPEKEQNNPNSVKMVRGGDSALWFGRGMTGYGLWHLGVYGYTKNALQCYNQMQIEKEELVEKLEQLRWLKNGWQIGCLSVQFNGVEINTPEDVDVWHHNKNFQ